MSNLSIIPELFPNLNSPTDTSLDEYFKNVPTLEITPNESEIAIKQQETIQVGLRKQFKQSLIDRNKKTLFIGNLPLSCVKGKALKKVFSEYGSIESIRFRSIAFSDKLPRKVAFIKSKFHDSRDTLNAYIVFKEESSVEKALVMNGVLFEGKHMRVDRSEKTTVLEARDDKKCLFIGNLSFDAKEEDLWDFFGAMEVASVRVIRDKKTNVGKGFGYVEFKESSSVMLGLKLNGQELAGRKVRISKCESGGKTASTEGERAVRIKKGGSSTATKSSNAVKKVVKIKHAKRKAQKEAEKKL